MRDSPQKRFVYIVWTALGIVVMIWIVVLARAAGVFPQLRETPLTHVVGIFGVGLTVACGILWLAHAARVIELSPPIAKGLWVTLIVSILSTTVAVYKDLLATKTPPPSPLPPRVQIESFKLLKEDPHDEVPEHYQERDSPVYYGERAPISCIAMFSNLAQNPSGRYDAEVIVSLENETSELSEVGRLRRTEKIGDWAKRLSQRVDDIKKLFPDWQNKVAWPVHFVKRPGIGTGSLKLHFTVIDNVTHYADTATIRISVNPQRKSSSKP